MSKSNGEAKATKFSQLASLRTSRALQAIRKIGTLNSRQRYEYTPQQIEKISSALHDAVEEIEARFKEPGAVKTNEFTV